jgi:hypothetical protein
MEQATLRVDHVEDRPAHERRNHSRLRRRQVGVEDAAIGEQRVEVLDERSVVGHAAEIVVPRLQTDGQEMQQQITLDLRVAHVLHVDREIERIGALPLLDPDQPARVCPVIIEVVWPRSDDRRKRRAQGVPDRCHRRDPISAGRHFAR